ncbi:MAG TPA: cysteine--tRNA ligase [Clostridiaceae bacterium]|nr:cysteine--tRNA ligase [Clostridiaceae bacterium]
MQIYNSMTRQKEALTPLEKDHFKIYVCGPTVYDYFHLGNARPFVVYDTLRRYLLWLGNKVTYVQNFTDIDDKVILRAHADGISSRELADRMIEEYFRDADALNIMRASVHPRATESIDDIIGLVQTLVDKGHAYVAPDGVYFSIDTFPDYGKLSGHNLDDLIAGASERVSETEGKRNPLDFVLWKFKKEGEPFWPSPWGDGRPGWHIECSAMSLKNLGKTVDIHAGGVDLTFPHHENEIAQSEAATGKPFVRYWVHNGFVNVNYEKMSKSIGNFFTVRDLTERYPSHILRFFILQAHYRMPINFSDDLLDAAMTGWQRITSSVAHLAFVAEASKDLPAGSTEEEDLRNAVTTARYKWKEAMDDDLNTADAIAVLFDLVRAANTASASGRVSAITLLDARDTLIELFGVLGLDPAAGEDEEIPADIMALADERTRAKEARDYARADALRDQIQAMGYKIEDTPQGVRVLPLE